MRSKPGGNQISVVIGDMADVDVVGQYQVIYLVYNTLFNLTGVGRQEDCFRNVARVMAPGGAFVIEAYVPEREDLDAQRRVEVRSVTEDSVELRMHRDNYEAQRFIRQTVVIADGWIQLKPFSLHYLWPGADRRAGRPGRATFGSPVLQLAA